MKRFCGVLLLVLAACTSSQGHEASQAPSGPPPAKPQVPAPPEPRTNKKYNLSVESPSQSQRGQPSQFRILLEPAPGFHINEEFPFEIVLDSPETKLAKGRLGKADAKAFSPNRVRFEVQFVPNVVGEASFSAHVRFAICTDNDCWPMREVLRWKTPVVP